MHAYLCGHDHISEHLIYGDVHFFVVGAGALTDSVKSSSTAQLVWAGAGYSAFGVATASPSDITLSFVDTSGSFPYSYTLTNPNAYTPPASENPPGIPALPPVSSPSLSSEENTQIFGAEGFRLNWGGMLFGLAGCGVLGIFIAGYVGRRKRGAGSTPSKGIKSSWRRASERGSEAGGEERPHVWGGWGQRSASRRISSREEEDAGSVVEDEDDVESAARGRWRGRRKGRL